MQNTLWNREYTIIERNGNIQSFSLTEKNKYNLHALFDEYFKENAFIFFHDHEGEDISLWNGCLIIPTKYTKKQEELIKLLLSLEPNMNSFYSQTNFQCQYYFHANNLETYKPNYPCFLMLDPKIISDALTSNIILIHTDKIEFFSDETINLIDIFRQIHEINFKSLLHAITYNVNNDQLVFIKNNFTSLFELYLPANLNYFQRSFLYNLKDLLPNITSKAYQLQNIVFELLWNNECSYSLVDMINFSTKQDLVPTLKKKYRDF